MKTASTTRKETTLTFAGVSYVLFLSLVSCALFFCSGRSIAQETSSGSPAAKQPLETVEEKTMAFDRGMGFDGGADGNRFAVTLHRPNYFLPLTYNAHPNAATYEAAGTPTPNDYEAKFQLSIKMLLWDNIFKDNGDLYGAYTQLSLWQIYDESSPFRETNYEPELFLKFDTDFKWLGLQNRRLIVGVNHQSNGQGGDFSRSWNRLYMEFIATRGAFVLGVKPWYRIPESEADDDNPDLDKYLGYGQLFAAYGWAQNVFALTLRNNLRFSDNKGSIEIGWSYPLTNNLRAYIQYFNGYGESLIDYNNSTNRIGCGIMVNDWI